MNAPERKPTPAEALEKLLGVMAKLRSPDGGCPWDREQTFATIAPFTIEEAYEVADAIAGGDVAAIREEVGDLLFQVVFYAQIAREAGQFDFAEVAQGIAEKMERRHPHVFDLDADKPDSASAQVSAWEAVKDAERQSKGEPKQPASVLDGVARALPALTRAEKLTKRAARHRFDWATADQVLGKIEEEIAELRAEMKAGSLKDRVSDELGDLLLAVANLGRKLEVDPEAALRAANDKFTRRFQRVEALLRERGKVPSESTLEEMDALWDQVKLEERR
ncbi:MAG TPA: nucleoside triphosphate pyrophosphohydrolase [Alphaproteobacteria bacterium]|nr:nucleoside triphosphate pyrophosphohydrolase [Alphaproteobacteria bacterium]